MEIKFLIFSSTLLLCAWDINVSQAQRIIRHQFEISYISGSPDGVNVNHILGINGQFPGPSIQARVGDRIEVEVINRIQNGQNVTIHWHGIHQRGTPFEDGPSLITQCPITTGSRQTYSFIVNLPGTYWYHSHVNSQYTEGLWGTLIVRNINEVYRYDDEFTITLNDWYHQSAHDNELWYMDKGSGGEPPYPSSALMNNVGRYPCPYALRAFLNCNTGSQRRPRFILLPNRIYRLRLINTSGWTAYNFTIDGYKLQTIEVDGVDVAMNPTPYEVDAVFIGAGQRYSFLIRTGDQVEGNRAIVRAYARTEFLFNTGTRGNVNPFPIAFREYSMVTGVIEYAARLPGGALVQTTTERFDYTQVVPQPPVPIESQDFLNELLLFPSDGERAPIIVNQEFIFTVQFLTLNDGIRRASLNGRPFHNPFGKPLLMKVLDNEPLPETVNAFYLDYMNSVQIVVNNPQGGPHPFHLHGHHFYVVGMGVQEDGDYNPAIHRLNTNAMRRDTVMVKEHSYLVIRFIADNPGVWTFHCHIDWHNLSGMIVNFIEAAPEARSTISYTNAARQTCAENNITLGV